MQQTEMFETERMPIELQHIESWKICWGWNGPVAGEYCQVNTPIVEKENGERLYCYMERCKLIMEMIDGRWLVEIDMPLQNGKQWSKNGTRLLLGITDIWPNCRHFEHDA